MPLVPATFQALAGVLEIGTASIVDVAVRVIGTFDGVCGSAVVDGEAVAVALQRPLDELAPVREHEVVAAAALVPAAGQLDPQEHAFVSRVVAVVFVVAACVAPFLPLGVSTGVAVHFSALEPSLRRRVPVGLREAPRLQAFIVSVRTLSRGLELAVVAIAPEGVALGGAPVVAEIFANLLDASKLVAVLRVLAFTERGRRDLKAEYACEVLQDEEEKNRHDVVPTVSCE